jgi:prephenate dehydrogenase
MDWRFVPETMAGHPDNDGDAEPMPFSFGLIGYGHFGAFLHVLAQRYLPDAPLKIHSGRRKPDGVLFFPLEEVAACDAVVLAVPISAYAATLARIRPHLGADSVVVDVATVKKHTMDLLQAAQPAHSFLATHPMFGPESYAKRGGKVTGLRIVVTGHNLASARYSVLCAKLAAVGFSIVEKTAEAHDKDLAETLFLTHYIGQVVARGGFERTDIDTVSFGSLMDAVDSVRHDRQLFEEVSRFNPYCRQVIERFDASDRQVRNAMLGLLQPERDQG